MQEKDNKGNVIWSDGSDYDIYGETAEQKADRVKSAQLDRNLYNTQRNHGLQSSEYAQAAQAADKHAQDMWNKNLNKEDVHYGINDIETAKKAAKFEQDQIEAKAKAAQREANSWKNRFSLGNLKTAGMKALTGDLIGALGTFSSAKVMPSGWDHPSERIGQTIETKRPQGLGSIGLSMLGNQAKIGGSFGNVGGMVDLKKMSQNAKARQLERASDKALKGKMSTMEYQEPSLQRPSKMPMLRTQPMDIVGDRANTLAGKISNLSSSSRNGGKFKLGADTSNSNFTTTLQPSTVREIESTQKRINEIGTPRNAQEAQELQRLQNSLSALSKNNNTRNDLVNQINQANTYSTAQARRESDRRNLIEAGNKVNEIQGADDTNMTYGYNQMYNDKYNEYINNGYTEEQAKNLAKIDVANDATTMLSIPATVATLGAAGAQRYMAGQSAKKAALGMIKKGGFKALTNQSNRSLIQAAVTGAMAMGAKGAMAMGANTVPTNNEYESINPNPYTGDTIDLIEGVGRNTIPSYTETSPDSYSPRSINEEPVYSNEEPVYSDEDPTYTENTINEDNFDSETSDRNMKELSQEEKEEMQRAQKYEQVRQYIQKVYGLDIGKDTQEFDPDQLKNGYVANSKFDDNLGYLIADELQDEQDVSQFNQELTQEEFEDFIKANPWVADMIINSFGQQ